MKIATLIAVLKKVPNVVGLFSAVFGHTLTKQFLTVAGIRFILRKTYYYSGRALNWLNDGKIN